MSEICYANPYPYASLAWRREPIDVSTVSAQVVTPRVDGEPRTGDQNRYWNTPLGYGVPGLCLPGTTPAPNGDYSIWTAMDADPSLTLSRAIITAPIREAGKSYDAREGTPDEWVKQVQEAIDPLWDEWLRESLDALSMGWSPFEVILDRRDGRTVIADLKPLASDYATSILFRDGKVIGLRNDFGKDRKAIDLPLESSFWVTVDGKKRNHYGRPWHENARTAWWSKLHCMAELAKLNRKASGIQGQGFFPPASDEAENHTNEKVMQTLLKRYMQGDGVVMPNAAGLLNSDTAADFRNIQGLAESALWKIQLDDHGQTGPHALALLDQLRYWNADLSRAWHVPERAGQQGEHGTNAESETQSQINQAMSQLVFVDMCSALSRGPIDTMLVQNYGEQARGAVKVTAGKIRDVYAEADWKLIDAVLRQPDLFMAVAEQVDLDAVFTRRGIPKIKSVLTLTEAVEEVRQQREETRKAEANAKPAGANGNGRFGMSREQETRATEWIDGLALLGRLEHE